MEQHPIPQDVTGFQFRLIGDMTVKQFAYLAGAAILCWICYSLPLTGLIRFPLMLLIGGFGIALAFVPIEGRPLDVMLTHFVKALFTPTQYTYQKIGGKLTITSVQTTMPQKQMTNLQNDPGSQQKSDESIKKLQMYLKQLPHNNENTLDKKEQVFFESLSHGFAQTSSAPHLTSSQPQQLPPKPTQRPYIVTMKTDQTQMQQPQQPANPTPFVPKEQPSQDQDTHQEEILIQETHALQKALADAKKQEDLQKQAHQETTQAHEKVIDLEQQLNDTMLQKQQLEEQLLRLQKRLDTKQQQIFTPTTAQPIEKPVETQQVRRIPKGMETKVGTPMTPDSPNIIMGIIKDPRGNVLPNILVEVKDAEGNPVRAFKTNQLGQFASATPLLNGTYTIEFEDSTGKNTFATIQLGAIGEIMEPLEVISNDQREDLRKTLFGNG